MANKTSKDPILTEQGARPTERSENQRATKADPSTGETHVTENSENKRAKTVQR